MSRNERSLEALAGAGVLAFVAYAVAVWPDLPERVPTHFGLSGPPDRWGPRATLAILPGMAVLLYVGLSVAQRFPHTFNFPARVTAENAERFYAMARRLMVELKIFETAILGYLFWLCAAIARGHARALPAWFFPAAMALLLALVVSAAFRMKRA